MPDQQTPNLFVFCKRARSHISQGRYDDALEVYDDLVAAAPAYATAWADRGTLLGLMNRREEALTSLRKAIALGFADPAAYNAMGTILGQMGLSQSALEAYAKAIEIDPAYPFTYFNRSGIFEKLKDNAAARADLEACLRFDADEGFHDAVRGRIAALG